MSAHVKPTAVYVFLALIIAFASELFDLEEMQSAYFTVPFLSGAANFEWGRGWVYNEADITRFYQLETREAKEAHRIPRTEDPEDLKPYHFQKRGFLYVSLAARNLFFWKGDLKAIDSLQVLVHIVITLFFVSLLPRRLSKVLFLLLYGVNPLILRYATFPYHYFWQVIPTALMLPYLLDRKFRFGFFALLVPAVLAFIHTVRPTMVFVSVLLLIWILLRESRAVVISSVAVSLVCAVALYSYDDGFRKGPWHTAYTALGAYPNPYGIERFADEYAHHFFEEEIGEERKWKPGGSFYQDVASTRYTERVKKEYLKIVRENPLLVLRNAILNYFQSFSIGYLNLSRTLSYLSALVGFLYFGVLLLKRRYLFIVAISLASGSFVPYCPPIQIYMYGSYILLVGSLIDLLNDYPVLDRLLPTRSPGSGSRAARG
jgi:hypothetical protein